MNSYTGLFCFKVAKAQPELDQLALLLSDTTVLCFFTEKSKIFQVISDQQGKALGSRNSTEVRVKHNLSAAVSSEAGMLYRKACQAIFRSFCEAKFHKVLKSTLPSSVEYAPDDIA
ncbi:uncharacterized protein LOC118189445 [Stegodyphus dumicola]|uniref:uncharacterized protein LOC118189445 n=1 Tax=Stegodyphus dumicola TaxID=202533 RepID=UPI0015AC7925|nr:uncharacterized protein LOC118189445 [Stegodyphus dumicola]